MNSSVDAWYSTTIDIEEVLSNTRQGDLHIFVADMVKSFDTVDRDILDCALGRLGFPAWFRKVYFSFHRDVRFYCCAIRSLVPALGKPQRYYAPSCILTILSAPPLMLTPYLVLPVVRSFMLE